MLLTFRKPRVRKFAIEAEAKKWHHRQPSISPPPVNFLLNSGFFMISVYLLL